MSEFFAEGYFIIFTVAVMFFWCLSTLIDRIADVKEAKYEAQAAEAERTYGVMDYARFFHWGTDEPFEVCVGMAKEYLASEADKDEAQ